MLTMLNPPVPNYASPGGSVSVRNNQRMATDLQKELACYGLAYQEAKQGVNKLKGQKNFGLKRTGNEYNLYFPEDVTDLGGVQGAQLASLKPAGTETFDMLQSSPAEFGKKLSMKDPKSVKNYLRKLLESC